jgi:hypothetical protein
VPIYREFTIQAAKLLVRQLHLSIAHRHLAPRGIDDELADPPRARMALAMAAQ